MEIAAAEVNVDAEVDELAPPAWPRVVRLAHPVDYGSERITQLEFRRGRMGDLKGMKLSDTVPSEQLMLIASRMCGQPIKVIESLDVDDAGEVMGIALVFFEKCLTAGPKR